MPARQHIQESDIETRQAGPLFKLIQTQLIETRQAETQRAKTLSLKPRQ